MIICTFYSHETGFDKVVDVLKSVYPKGLVTIGTMDELQVAEMEAKGGFFGSDKKLKISYRERKIPSYQLPEEDDSPLTGNLKGLYGFVYSLPAKNENLKGLLLAKIRTLNSEFSIIQEKGNDSDLKKLVSKLALEFDAFIFAQPNTPISRSPEQHFLDKSLRLLLDRQGNSIVDHLDIKIKSIYFDADQQTLTNDQKERKERSEAILRGKDVKINTHLPAVESESQTRIRSLREIAERLCVLAVVNRVAFGQIGEQEAIDYLQKYGCWEWTTPNEMDLLLNPTKEKKTRESWKYEGIYVLLWALNQVDELYFPVEMINMDNLEIRDYPIGNDKDPNDFINSALNVREKAEILDANDLYYRLDWACVDARVKNRTIEGVQSAVVYERHYALNWLIHYSDQDWDDVSCDT